jgi:hypothetical protein
VLDIGTLLQVSQLAKKYELSPQQAAGRVHISDSSHAASRGEFKLKAEPFLALLSR